MFIWGGQRVIEKNVYIDALIHIPSVISHVFVRGGLKENDEPLVLNTYSTSPVSFDADVSIRDLYKK